MSFPFGPFPLLLIHGSSNPQDEQAMIPANRRPSFRPSLLVWAGGVCVYVCLQASPPPPLPSSLYLSVCADRCVFTLPRVWGEGDGGGSLGAQLGPICRLRYTYRGLLLHTITTTTSTANSRIPPLRANKFSITSESSCDEVRSAGWSAEVVITH
jgi:hypothetical protein